MLLIDRLILLVIELSPEQCVGEANLQFVLGVLSKRYKLGIDPSGTRLAQSLAALRNEHIDRTPSGYRLNDGGRWMVHDMRRRQTTFCRKFHSVTNPIIRRCTSRSNASATV